MTTQIVGGAVETVIHTRMQRGASRSDLSRVVVDVLWRIGGRGALCLAVVLPFDREPMTRRRVQTGGSPG